MHEEDKIKELILHEDSVNQELGIITASTIYGIDWITEVICVNCCGVWSNKINADYFELNGYWIEFDYWNSSRYQILTYQNNIRTIIFTQDKQNSFKRTVRKLLTIFLKESNINYLP